MKHQFVMAIVGALVLSTGCSYDIDDKKNETEDRACFDGQTQCPSDINILRICQNNKFVDSMNCLNEGKICGTDDKGRPDCVFEPPPKACEGSSSDECYHDLLFRCKDSRWSLKTECPKDNNICMQNSEGKNVCGTCDSGTFACRENQVLACGEGKYRKFETCPTHLRCIMEDPSQNTVQPKCQCLKEDTYCEGDDLLTCNATRDGFDRKPCAEGEKCVKGEDSKSYCTKGECVTDQERCTEAGEHQKCVNETWQTVTCETDEICRQEQDKSGQCVKRECEENTYQCDKLNMQQCVKGRWQDIKESCPDKTECVFEDPKSKPSCQCIKDQWYCIDNALYQCGANGEKTNETPCEAANCHADTHTCDSAQEQILACNDGILSNGKQCYQGCNDDKSGCAECTDQDKRCEGDVLISCDMNNGHTVMKNNCENGRKCIEGKCESTLQKAPKYKCADGGNGLILISQKDPVVDCKCDQGSNEVISSIFNNDSIVNTYIVNHGDAHVCKKEFNETELEKICSINLTYCADNGAIYAKSNGGYYFIGLCDDVSIAKDKNEMSIKSVCGVEVTNK